MTIVPTGKQRIIRGIRDSIPSGYVIGRASLGNGPAEPIPLSRLGQALTQGGFVLTPDGLSAAFDSTFGATEGMIIQRGPLIWQALSPPSGTNLLLASGGTGALNSWQTLSALLDALYGNGRGNLLVRTSTGWAALARGVANQFFGMGTAGLDPQWISLITGAPNNGNLVKFSGSFGFTNTDLSGDVTTNGTSVTAIKSSVNLSGSPTTTTQSPLDSSIKIATTKYVDDAVAAGGGGGGGSLELTDGVTDLTSVTKITVSNMTVGGTSPAATLTPNTATGSTLGIVKPDGISITVSGGVISAAASGINQLTGDVTAGPGSGSQAATIGANKVTYAKLQQASGSQLVLGAQVAGDYIEVALDPATLTISGGIMTATASGGGAPGSVASVAGDGIYLTTSPAPITTTGTVSPTTLTQVALLLAATALFGGP